MRIDLDKVRDRDGSSTAAPSLEEFALERGLEEFPLEDQLAYYREARGAGAQKAKRDASRLRRQLDALASLEQVAAETSFADDRARLGFHST